VKNFNETGFLKIFKQLFILSKNFLTSKTDFENFFFNFWYPVTTILDHCDNVTPFDGTGHMPVLAGGPVRV